MPYKDKQRQYEAIKQSSCTVTVRFQNTTDAEIIDWLNKQEQKSTAIKRILRAAIKDGRC